MSRKHLISATLLSIAALCSQAITPQYQNPVPGEFPILGWYSIPDSASTPERYREMRDAGFNISFSHLKTNDEIAKALEAASGTGVKLILTSFPLVNDTEATVNEFKNHPNTAGWFLRDEPTVAQFAGLAKFRDRVYAADTTHLVYLNLLPIMVPPTELGTDTYDDYLQQFLDSVHLPMISYDMYPIVEDSGRVYVRPQLYSNLESARRVSNANNCKFWSFCLSTAHTPYPVPRDPHMRLEAFAALAYGAQGLQYFTYWQPASKTWNFHHAPIDATGHRTDVYYMIRDLNREIQALAPIFLDCEVYNVGHTGSMIPEGTDRLESMPAPFTSLPTSDGEGLLVSHFKGGDSNSYIMIVNRDIDHDQIVNAPFDGTLTLVNPDASTRQASQINHVRPGGYLLYRL